MSDEADRIVGLYRRHARAWAADRGRALGPEKAWLDRFAALLPPGAPVLDIGCGPAEPVAAYLIARGFDVSGADSSPTMVSLCRARFPDRDWRVADMRALALGRTLLDAVPLPTSTAEEWNELVTFARASEPSP